MVLVIVNVVSFFVKHGITQTLVTIETRIKRSVWLVGQPESFIEGSKLPSKKQVLKLFFYKHLNLDNTLRQSARETVENAIEFWSKARIPTKEVRNATDCLLKIHSQWCALKKDKNRSSEVHEKKLKMKMKENFLDRKLHTMETARAERQALKEMRKIKTRVETLKANAKVVLESSSTSSDTGSDSGATTGEEFFKPPSQKRPKQNIVSPEVVAALDRTGTSNRKASLILEATATSLGHDAEEITVSYSAVRRSRSKHRQDLYEQLKEEFQASDHLVVHWDGKLLPDFTGDDPEKNVDRLPVLVSGGGQDQLLGVPKFQSGTGENQAKAVVECLNDWNLSHKTVGICFDTTASNTGSKSGACVTIENLLGKDLLHLACRHHVIELVLKAAFDELMGNSTSPTIPLFNTFKQGWNNFDKCNYETYSSDYFIVNALRNREVLKFCENQLKEQQPREDYRELLQLCVVFLEGELPKEFTFRKPEAIHRARWMNKAIYSFKIFMFQDQFALTPTQKKAFRNLIIFLCSVYVKAWFSAPCALSAARLDLEFLQSMAIRKPPMWRLAAEKFSRHLWYLSPMLVGIAFFDPDLSTDIKRKMVLALKRSCDDPEADVLVTQCSKLSLDDFVSDKTMDIFRMFNIDSAFLHVDPEMYSQQGYANAVKIFKNLKVVNDNTERAVALITEFTSVITKDEAQKQYLLHVVSKHRKKHPLK